MSLRRKTCSTCRYEFLQWLTSEEGQRASRGVAFDRHVHSRLELAFLAGASWGQRDGLRRAAEICRGFDYGPPVIPNLAVGESLANAIELEAAKLATMKGTT